MSCAAFLAVDMPTVGVGEAIYPVLTTNAVAGTPAENAVQAETTGGFSASVLTPSRIQASFYYSQVGEIGKYFHLKDGFSRFSQKSNQIVPSTSVPKDSMTTWVVWSFPTLAKPIPRHQM